MSNVLTETKVGGASPLALKVMQLNAKIKRGEYVFEETPCFCGSNGGIALTNRDRYGIFYTMKLCPKCGVMYASPHMVKDSLEKFYKHDYRDIYVIDARGMITQERDWENGIERGEGIRELLKEHEIESEVVFDIGCNIGQNLEVFKDKECYGVDYDEDSIKFAQDKGLNVFLGGIEKLQALGKKADLIILDHVLEHFIDLREELDKISNLLNPTGVLLVGVPGLYTWHGSVLFQNAHNWQFNTKTLTYVMQACGWEAIYADAQILSLWKYTGEKNNDLSMVSNQAKEIWDYKWSGNNILPSYDPVCKFSLKERRKNVRETLSYKLKDISNIHQKELGKDSIIISGGPSIEGYIDRIKEMQREGKVVIAIERMYQWCQDNAIVPNYILVMDASDDVIESFDRVHPATIHILATQCNTEIFERLKNENTYIYSSAQSNISFVEEWEQNEYKKVTMINTGGSVTLGCIAISMFLGMKNLHVFGFDCHVSKKNYADGITGVGYVKDIFTVDIDGKEFNTTPIYVSFARQFFQMWQLGKSIGLIEDIKIYGDSMVKAMSKIDIDGDKNDS